MVSRRGWSRQSASSPSRGLRPGPGPASGAMADCVGVSGGFPAIPSESSDSHYQSGRRKIRPCFETSWLNGRPGLAGPRPRGGLAVALERSGSRGGNGGGRPAARGALPPQLMAWSPGSGDRTPYGATELEHGPGVVRSEGRARGPRPDRRLGRWMSSADRDGVRGSPMARLPDLGRGPGDDCRAASGAGPAVGFGRVRSRALLERGGDRRGVHEIRAGRARHRPGPVPKSQELFSFAFPSGDGGPRTGQAGCGTRRIPGRGRARGRALPVLRAREENRPGPVGLGGGPTNSPTGPGGH